MYAAPIQRIIMPHGEKKKLEKDFKVSSPTVWAALCGITKTKLADTLRAAAIQRGGVIVIIPKNR